MRRKTYKLNTQSTERTLNIKRHKTYVINEGNVIKSTQLNDQFRFSSIVVNYLIEEILLTKCAEQLYKNQMEKLVNQAMNQCQTYLHNQNWQLNPNGPHQQKIHQSPLQPDPQPQCRIFDPMLTYKQPITQSQSSISLSRFKKNSHKFQRKSIFINQTLTTNDRRNSIRSTTSRKSNINVNFSMQNPKLIPLRFQNGITPQLTTRRTLEDFLRQKKTNADVNLGYKIRNYSEEKQNQNLRTILQFPKSGFLINTTRNFLSLNQTQTKLPQISMKDDLNTDYDGNAIQIKKASNLKKKAQILKMVCKVKEEEHEKNKTHDVHSKYFRPEHIKLKPIATQRKDSLNNNSNTLPMRFSTQDDIKSLVQNGLFTNRVTFRQQVESQNVIENDHVQHQQHHQAIHHHLYKKS